jgi:hypothetical protein
MKRCPTCGETFDDQLRFCQSDGTPLVDDAPAFDPYATIIASRPPMAEDKPSDLLDMGPDADGQSATPEAPPIAPPSEELQMPPVDPLKTMYVSEEELKEVMASTERKEDVLDIAAPEPPSFSEPEIPAPTFSDQAPIPPPSPFTAPAAGNFPESETVLQSAPVTYEERAPEPPPPTAFDAPPVFGSSPPPPAFEQPNPGYMEPQLGSPGGFQPPATVQEKNQTLAIVSLITGLAGLFFCGLTGPVGLITGWMARNKAKSDPSQYGGEVLALVGMITGGLATLILLGVIAYVIFVFLFVGFASL